ncbi:MAG: hypothetical protein U5K69_00745 [Balneolaceae bacterium]|nr:hypothetical protein [Balneolaceae bacterium]
MTSWRNIHEQLAKRLESELQKETNRQTLYQYMQQYPLFWGATLYRGTQQIVWNGFSFTDYPSTLLPDETGDDPFIDVITQNNVLSFLCRTTFAVEDSSGNIEYELLTTARIEQENALPIGQSHEFHLLTENDESLNYPADFIFFETPPDSMLSSRVLSTASKDSVGLAYIPSGIAGGPIEQWDDRAFFWRSLLGMVSYIAIVFFLYLRLGRNRSWTSLLLQLLLVAGSWTFFHFMEIPSRWLTDVMSDTPISREQLVYLAKISLFSFWGSEAICPVSRPKVPGTYR